MNVLDRIGQVLADAAKGCSHCGTQLSPRGPSTLFCGEDCQEAYYGRDLLPPGTLEAAAGQFLAALRQLVRAAFTTASAEWPSLLVLVLVMEAVVLIGDLVLS